MGDRPSEDVCCNYNDVDPISLEEVKDLQHFFYCTSKKTGRVEAYDAVAWLRYFAKTPSRWPEHPCTREPLQPRDIWDCYVVAHGVLGEDDADVMRMHSDKVIAKVNGNLVELRAQSPLFVICIREVATMSEADADPKQIKVCYTLVSSSDPSVKRSNKHTYSIKVTVPPSFCVSITR